MMKEEENKEQKNTPWGIREEAAIYIYIYSSTWSYVVCAIFQSSVICQENLVFWIRNFRDLVDIMIDRAVCIFKISMEKVF